MIPPGAIDEDTPIRFCARWRILFNAASFPLLRLRLVSIPELDADIRDPTINASMRSVVEVERATWEQANESLRIYTRTHIEWQEFNRHPELCALVIGHRLFFNGHSPIFLSQLTPYWMWVLTNIRVFESLDEDKRASILRRFDSTGFSFEKWESEFSLKYYDCYLVPRNRSRIVIRAHHSIEPISLSELPLDVSEMLATSSLDTANSTASSSGIKRTTQRVAIKSKSLARDGYAAETAKSWRRL
jgi:hypothetical protein